MNLCFITDFSESRNQSGFLRVIEREFRRVSVKFCRVLANGDCTRRSADSFTDSGHSARRNSLLLRQQNLEARVGIGPFSPQLRVKNARFDEEINLNLLNQTKPILTVLVSVLVSATKHK